MSSEWSLVGGITANLSRHRLGDLHSPNLWPSEASAEVNGKLYGKCRRATFIRFAIDQARGGEAGPEVLEIAHEAKALKIPVDPYMAWIWRQGELYEKMMIEDSKVLGVYIQEQVSVLDRSLHLSGKIDLIVFNPISTKKSVVEFKSVYGYNSTAVLGTPASIRKNQLGEPRDSNLMQIAIYQDKMKRDPEFEYGRLVYGARDTGKHGEYKIIVHNDSSIEWSGLYPVVTEPHIAPFTVNDIYQAYKNTLDAIAHGVLPPRDFELKYSDQKILGLYYSKGLGKTDTAKVESHLNRKVENENRALDGKAPLKELKLPEKGDWQCDRCSYKNFCYKLDGTPRN